MLLFLSSEEYPKGMIAKLEEGFETKLSTKSFSLSLGGEVWRKTISSSGAWTSVEAGEGSNTCMSILSKEL